MKRSSESEASIIDSHLRSFEIATSSLKQHLKRFNGIQCLVKPFIHTIKYKLPTAFESTLKGWCWALDEEVPKGQYPHERWCCELESRTRQL